MAAIIRNKVSGETITVQNAKAVGDHLLYQARLGVPSQKWQIKNLVIADGMDVDTGCCILRPIEGWEVEVGRKARAPRKAKASVTTPAPTTQNEPTIPSAEPAEPVATTEIYTSTVHRQKNGTKNNRSNNDASGESTQHVVCWGRRPNNSASHG